MDATAISIIFFLLLAGLAITGVVGLSLYVRERLHALTMDRLETEARIYTLPVTPEGNLPGIYDPETKTIIQGKPGNFSQFPQLTHYAPHTSVSGRPLNIADSQDQRSQRLIINRYGKQPAHAGGEDETIDAESSEDITDRGELPAPDPAPEPLLPSEFKEDFGNGLSRNDFATGLLQMGISLRDTARTCNLTVWQVRQINDKIKATRSTEAV